MEIFKNFGFDSRIFFAQIVNFLILVYIFRRFLYEPIIKLITAREEKIKKGIEDAENAKVSYEEAQKEKDIVLKNTAVEAQKIVEEARNLARETGEEIIKRAQKDAGLIIKKAQEQGRVEIEKARLQLKTTSVALSREILGKIIQQLFTNQEKEDVLRRSVDKLKQYE